MDLLMWNHNISRVNGVKYGTIDDIKSVLSGMQDVFKIVAGQWAAIHIAAANGLNDEIEELLKIDPRQLNYLSGEHLSPLSIAVEFSHELTVKQLLNKGANPNIDMQCKPPLQCAIENNNENIVEILMLSGADVNRRNINNETSLHFSCYNGNLLISKMLIENGATIANKNAQGYSAVHFAIMSQNVELIEYILQKMNATDLQPANLVTSGVKKHWNGIYYNGLHQLNLISSSMQETAKLPKYYSLLHFAVKNGSLESIMRLFALTEDHLKSKKCDKTFAKCLLHTAIIDRRNQESKYEVIKFLLNNGIKVNECNISQNALFCHWYKCPERKRIGFVFAMSKIKSYYGMKADISFSALGSAAFYSEKRILLELIGNGAEINPELLNVVHPLFPAICTHHMTACETLLENGANPNYGVIINRSIYPSILQAASFNCSKFLFQLLKAGADVRLVSLEFWTLLPEYLSKSELLWTNILLLSFLGLSNKLKFRLELKEKFNNIWQTDKSRCLAVGQNKFMITDKGVSAFSTGFVSLQHICRAVVVGTILVANKWDLYKKYVDELPISTVYKHYLKYESIEIDD